MTIVRFSESPARRAARASGDPLVEAPSMAERLRQVEDHTRLGLAQRIRMATPVEPDPDPDEVAAPARLVPVPRRARMFVLHGQGQGFADVVLTRPPRTTPPSTTAPVSAAEQRPHTYFW